jgi:hypothetical protein
MPRIIIIAGPNGAGKTTFAAAYPQREAKWPHFIRNKFRAPPLRRSGIQNCDRHSAKVGGVEGEEPGDVIALHGRHEASIVCPEARHIVGLHECLP